jgi:hypothetical protein
MNLVSLTVAQIEEVILLADSRTARGTREEVEMPADLSKNYGSDCDRAKMVTAIKGLSVTAQNELMAFMWLGQGSIGLNLSRWNELVQSARDESVNNLPDQIASNVCLHKHLRRALEMMGQGMSIMNVTK